jgi:hypothetical protein
MASVLRLGVSAIMSMVKAVIRETKRHKRIADLLTTSCARVCTGVDSRSKAARRVRGAAEEQAQLIMGGHSSAASLRLHTNPTRVFQGA